MSGTNARMELADEAAAAVANYCGILRRRQKLVLSLSSDDETCFARTRLFEILIRSARQPSASFQIVPHMDVVAILFFLPSFVPSAPAATRLARREEKEEEERAISLLGMIERPDSRRRDDI